MTRVFLPGMIMNTVPPRSLQPPWGSKILRADVQPGPAASRSSDCYEGLMPDTSTQMKAPFPTCQAVAVCTSAVGLKASAPLAYWVHTVSTRAAERNCCCSHDCVSGFRLQLKYLVCWLMHQNSFLSDLSHYCYLLLFIQLQRIQDMPMSLILPTSFPKEDYSMNIQNRKAMFKILYPSFQPINVLI